MRSRAGWAGIALPLTLTLALAGAATADARAPRQFYGVVPQLAPSEADLERMGRGGVGTVRHAIFWADIVPSSNPAEVDWRELDRIVGGAARHRLRVVPSVFGTPDWVSELEGCVQRCEITPPKTAAGLRAWRAFVGALVWRYGPRGVFWHRHPELPHRPIRAWQVWNEPNSPMFYGPRPDVFRYAQLVFQSALAIRAQDPRAKVLLGGMFGTPRGAADGARTAWDFLQGLYAVGLEPYFDGVALHPYGGKLRRVKDQVRRVRRVVRVHGSEPAPIWVTEIGWTSGGERTPLNRGPKGQARRLRQSFRWFTRNRRRLGIELIAWYAWRDVTRRQARCGWCPHAGLFRKRGRGPKPAWRAYRSFTGAR